MVFFSQIIFCLLTALVCGAPPQKGKFPFPILDKNLILHDSSTPYYVFDGIDYEELPSNIKDQYYNCYSEHLKCIRNRYHFHEVCAYAYWYDWGNYYSICQLEHMNCQQRMYYGKGFYGSYYADDLIFYQGDGVHCSKSQNPREERRSLP